MKVPFSCYALLLAAALLWLAPDQARAQESVKCDNSVLLHVSRHMGKVLRSDIKTFLMTFSEECRQNAEFSEWSNELLFNLLDEQTEDILAVLEKNKKHLAWDIIMNELRSPINDALNINIVAAKVEGAVNGRTVKEEILINLR